MIGPVITFWPNYLEVANGSEWRPESWDLVFKRLSEPKPFRGDREHPGWSAARFEPRERALKNVREVYALCLDYDNKAKGGGMLAAPVSIDQAAELWSGHAGLIHTSRSHMPCWPRYRLVLPLSRPVSTFEYGALWTRVKGHAGAIDDAPKDPSRFWYLPGVRDGGTFESRRLGGTALDVDLWLAKPEPTVRLPYVQPQRMADPDRNERRAIAYVRTMDPAIQGQEGSKQTLKAAVVIARGFDLSEGATLQILRSEYNPRCVPPWSESELKHKAADARHKSRLPLGFMLDGDDDRPACRISDESPEFRDDIAALAQPEPTSAATSATLREPGDDTDDIQAEVTQQAKPPSAVERYNVLTERQIAVAVFRDATSGESAKGYTTGIIELDEMLCGIRREHIVLAAAQTSWGKSTLSSMIATENRKAGVKVLLVSNEDKPLMYGRRLACSSLNINAMRLRDRELSAKELGMLGEHATHASNDYMFFDAVGMPVETVGQAITELCAENGFELVICDYLQRFRSSKSQERRNEVTTAMGTLSDAIKNARAAGLILSQVKRTDGRPPCMNDVKESGDVENMAEHVLIGWREIEKRNGEPDIERRKINVPKNKDGPASEDWLELRFDPVRAAFLPGHIKLPPGTLEARESMRQFDDFGDSSM